MADHDLECTCTDRPLGAEHRSSCPLWEYEPIDLPEQGHRGKKKVATPPGTVQVYRGDDGRPIAVPEEIVTEAEREYRAYLAHCKGTPWEDIALEEHYPSGMAACAAVKRYLDDGRAIVGDLRRREVIAIEVGRLNLQRQALWPAAMEGKIPANMALLSLHDRWVKLFGLDQPDPAEDPSNTATTVVINSETYEADLEAATAE